MDSSLPSICPTTAQSHGCMSYLIHQILVHSWCLCCFSSMTDLQNSVLSSISCRSNFATDYYYTSLWVLFSEPEVPALPNLRPCTDSPLRMLIVLVPQIKLSSSAFLLHAGSVCKVSWDLVLSFSSFSPGLKSSQERGLALDNASAVHVPCALLALLAAVHRKPKYHL